MRDFQKEVQKLNMKEEMMDDVLNDFDPTDADAEDAVIDEVLSSLSIDVNKQLDAASVPSNTLPSDKESVDLSDLEKQLDRLRN
ncbi:unnamed protein product [Echinostoma caproni]|uniref:Charged multivesicular body protein 5 n=1 Tax=Echinostoma caproni TaxID=27848 RepID=A0A183B786_9TREM|nr:unnamed protein product [Echinostoma caproni]